MIRLHDLTAINPVNVVYIELMKDCIFIQVWNGKGHRLLAVDGVNLDDLFADLSKKLAKDITTVPIRHGLVVNADAICSVAKVPAGIAVNLILPENPVVYSRVPHNDKEKEMCRILAAIDA